MTIVALFVDREVLEVAVDPRQEVATAVLHVVLVDAIRPHTFEHISFANKPICINGSFKVHCSALSHTANSPAVSL